jgi:hypothetical protein
MNSTLEAKVTESLIDRFWNARRKMASDTDQEHFRTQGWNEALEFVVNVLQQDERPDEILDNECLSAYQAHLKKHGAEDDPFDWLTWQYSWDAAKATKPVSVDLEAGAQAIKKLRKAAEFHMASSENLAKACAEAWGLPCK